MRISLEEIRVKNTAALSTVVRSVSDADWDRAAGTADGRGLQLTLRVATGNRVGLGAWIVLVTTKNSRLHSEVLSRLKAWSLDLAAQEAVILTEVVQEDRSSDEIRLAHRAVICGPEDTPYDFFKDGSSGWCTLLRDGNVLTLSADSAASYCKRFSGKTRTAWAIPGKEPGTRHDVDASSHGSSVLEAPYKRSRDDSEAGQESSEARRLERDEDVMSKYQKLEAKLEGLAQQLSQARQGGRDDVTLVNNDGDVGIGNRHQSRQDEYVNLKALKRLSESDDQVTAITGTPGPVSVSDLELQGVVYNIIDPTRQGVSAAGPVVDVLRSVPAVEDAAILGCFYRFMWSHRTSAGRRVLNLDHLVEGGGGAARDQASLNLAMEVFERVRVELCSPLKRLLLDLVFVVARIETQLAVFNDIMKALAAAPIPRGAQMVAIFKQTVNMSKLLLTKEEQEHWFEANPHAQRTSGHKRGASSGTAGAGGTAGSGKTEAVSTPQKAGAGGSGQVPQRSPAARGSGKMFVSPSLPSTAAAKGVAVEAKVGFKGFPVSACAPDLRAVYAMSSGPRSGCPRTAEDCGNLHHGDFVKMKMERKDVVKWVYTGIPDYDEMCTEILGDSKLRSN